MHTKSSNFYDSFSFLYPLIDIFLAPQKRKLCNEINTLPFGYLLEIGVGTGTHLKWYQTHKIIGIDTSLKMLEIAKKQKCQNVELIQMDGEVLSFEDQIFDYIVLSHVITVVDDSEKMLENVYRVLKTDGKVFILNHFTPNNWLMYVDRLFQSISKTFHFKSIFHIDHLKTIKKFTLLKQIHFGKLSYFKLLIYQKG